MIAPRNTSGLCAAGTGDKQEMFSTLRHIYLLAVSRKALVAASAARGGGGGVGEVGGGAVLVRPQEELALGLQPLQ